MGFVIMKTLTSIVAVNRDGAIGCQNQLPWRLRTDLKFFKAQTLNNVVIMGRKTYDSIGGCLPNRTNIVLSHNSVLFENTPTCQLSLSIPEVLFSTSRIRSKEVFVVGGASTYEQFAPFVDRYLVTVVDKPIEGADAFLSESVFGDVGDWAVSLIGEYPATPGIDEAPFAIYEWTAKNADVRHTLRESVVLEYANRNHLTKKSVSKIAPSNAVQSHPESLQLQL
jgi:dihydrofolate reductase